MEIEKEVRYNVNDQQLEKIKKITTSYKERTEMLDITCGYEGFDSYSKYGFICRIRQKGNDKTLEVKNYSNDNECLEQAIKLDKVIDGVNYLKLIGMEPYLYLKRFREIRKYKNLKIFIDEFDILGNFVEIEYQDSNNDELDEFIKLIDIQTTPEDMYGAIVKKKLETEPNFVRIFKENLDLILTSSQNKTNE